MTAEVALTLLRQQFPFARERCPTHEVPILLGHQIYSLVANRTAVDRELEALKKANRVRRIKLVSQRDEFGYVFLDDYLAKLRAVAATCPASSQQQLAVQRFADALAKAKWDVTVTRAQVIEATARSANELLPPEPVVCERMVSHLVHRGLLLARSDTRDVYWLAVPGSGRLIQDIAQGRVEMERLIRRRKHKEIPVAKLLLARLKKSGRGPRFHLRDMMGGGLVAVRPTSVGDVVALVDK